MTGLIYKDFLALKGHLTTYLVFFLVYGGLCLSGVFTASVLCGMVVLMSLITPMTTVTSDDVSRWNRFAIATPACRRGVVTGKYLFTLLVTLASTVFVSLLLAVLALAMVVIGIGDKPAIIALFLASLLPIVRNTHTALDSLPPGLREAGRGIGMTFWQRLRWVEIPMALPVIFGGIRTAVVMNIGVMAIAAVIGAGGLGLLLLNGIGGSDIRMLIAGALMICLLAIVLDWLLHRLQVVLTPKGIR